MIVLQVQSYQVAKAGEIKSRDIINKITSEAVDEDFFGILDGSFGQCPQPPVCAQ